MKPRITRRWVVPALALSLALVLVAAGGAAAVETDTVATFARGLLWSLALMTTVGFVGAAPVTATGSVLSVVLMVAGFLLLALVSAALASLFVRDDEKGFEDLERADLTMLLAEVRALREQVSMLAPPGVDEGSDLDLERGACRDPVASCRRPVLVARTRAPS